MMGSFRKQNYPTFLKISRKCQKLCVNSVGCNSFHGLVYSACGCLQCQLLHNIFMDYRIPTPAVKRIKRQETGWAFYSVCITASPLFLPFYYQSSRRNSPEKKHMHILFL